MGKPTSATALAKQFRLSWWDRALIGVAPSYGLNRVRARLTADLAARHYDAASMGRRTSGWRGSGTDANAANTPALSKLRDLSRDLRRNNGWARQAVRVIKNNTVGWGLSAKATGPFAAEADRIWKQWSRSIKADHDQRMNFSGLQGLAIETIVESGEVLALREPATVADGLAVPMRIRLIEPDYLDATKDGAVTNSSNVIRNGIELDNRGRRVAYWIYETHPGASGYYSTKSNRIDAANVAHCYLVERPGQLRGAPWLCAAIARLQDFDDYEDALLMQQKIAACFAAFVTDTTGESLALGKVDASTPQIEGLEPGMINYLKPGQSITFGSPPNVANQEVFSNQNLRRIAASVAVPYEEMTGDYSKVNFSSARMARISHYQHVHDWRWNMIVPAFCDVVFGWVMAEAAAIAGWPSIPGVEWTAPPMPLLEPDKEGVAYQRMIRAGVMTLQQAIRERGGDPDQHLAEFAESNAKIDQLGIVLDSDPRNTTTSGQAQASDAAEDDPDPVAVEDAAAAEEARQQARILATIERMIEAENAAARA